MSASYDIAWDNMANIGMLRFLTYIYILSSIANSTFSMKAGYRNNIRFVHVALQGKGLFSYRESMSNHHYNCSIGIGDFRLILFVFVF